MFLGANLFEKKAECEPCTKLGVTSRMQLAQEAAHPAAGWRTAS
jgi:hypothetical protein